MNQTEIIVRGYHCDAYGHVNNARYLEFFEEARWNFLQKALDAGIFEKMGLLFIVVNINVSYKHPVVPLQKIWLSIKNTEFRNMSIILKQQIHLAGTKTLCTEADVTFVLLNKKTGKPVVIDKSIRSVFEKLGKEDK